MAASVARWLRGTGAPGIGETEVGQRAFTEWTDAGELRHPRFQGLRDDKDPREVVREIPTSGEDRS
jgi:hypothetical protein